MKVIRFVGLLCSVFSILGEEVALKVERSTTITFPSQNDRAYKLLAAEAPSGTWSVLKDGIAGTGGDVTIFYKSESDQKLFFKVETSDGPPGQRSLISLARLDVSHRNLTGYDLEGADLREYKFYSSTLDNANLAGADLRGAGFQNASMRGADLRNVIFGNTGLYGVDLSGANLGGVNMAVPDLYLTEVNLQGAKLQGARLPASMTRVKLANTDLSGLSFRGVNLTDSDLTGATVTGANMEGADLGGVHMAGRDLRTVFLRGAGVGGGANWSGVNLAGSDLTLFNAGGANFVGADLSGANLTGFRAGGKISGVNFRNARLPGASFRDSDVSNCDFTGADLSFADFRGADLTGSIGINLEQAGMRFGPRTPPGPGSPLGYPDTPYGKGTILPDGTTRTGENPGTALGHHVIPARLVLNIDDNGRKETLDLAFANDRFGYGPGAPAEWNYDYYPASIVSTLALFANGNRFFTLLFTSQTGGQLYESDAGSDGVNSAATLVGTFQAP
jgi:uncharacterized protein YjbI with pentapeptide repeats